VKLAGNQHAELPRGASQIRCMAKLAEAQGHRRVARWTSRELRVQPRRLQDELLRYRRWPRSRFAAAKWMKAGVTPHDLSAPMCQADSRSTHWLVLPARQSPRLDVATIVWANRRPHMSFFPR